MNSEQLNIFNPSDEKQSLTWKSVLAEEKKRKYFSYILDQIAQERSRGISIYPENANIFNALQLTPFEDVRVVILGQDPYHGPGQAHGLCFSVQKGIKFPPSLQNIFKELQDDLGLPFPEHGCLDSWAKQGVLLLNAVLSVRAGQPQSHSNIGWEVFTDKIISALNEHKENIVFLLWGSAAQRKGSMIDPNKHYILTTTHPSPLSAHRGFLGCKHFSKTNQILRSLGHEEINWAV